MHAGKITEPWATMERLIEEVPHFAHLKVAKIKLWWQKDWKADVDSIVTGAQVCKASELDRNLVEEGGKVETVAIFVKLPEDQWPTLDAEEKEHRLFHELCHIKPAKDSNGNQKHDSKDRLLWRLGRHPIVAFHEEVDRYGVERILNHNAKIMESITHAKRPMERLFDEAEKPSGEPEVKGEESPIALAVPANGDWRITPVGELGFKGRDGEKLIAADVVTAGDLQNRMMSEKTWWNRDIQGVGEAAKERIEEVFTRFVCEHEPASGSASAT